MTDDFSATSIDREAIIFNEPLEEPAPIARQRPTSDHGNVDVTQNVFSHELGLYLHLYAEDWYVDTIERGDADSRRLDGLSPGRYRLLRRLDTHDRDCVQEVDIAPGQTLPVSLSFAYCATPLRVGDVR